jgi:hypothetical protein
VALTLLLHGLVAVAPAPTGAAGTVAVVVSCATNPERVTVRNNTSGAIRVTAVGSIYQPYSSEPYAVSRALAKGAAITFQSGAAASSNVLTRKYLFNNDVGTAEGARVRTTAGTFADRCG